jgi:hypothetical protein
LGQPSETMPTLGASANLVAMMPRRIAGLSTLVTNREQAHVLHPDLGERETWQMQIYWRF